MDRIWNMFQTNLCNKLAIIILTKIPLFDFPLHIKVQKGQILRRIILNDAKTTIRS